MNIYGFLLKASLLLVLAFSMLTACNTIQGVGKDIKKGGEALEKVAK